MCVCVYIPPAFLSSSENFNVSNISVLSVVIPNHPPPSLAFVPNIPLLGVIRRQFNEVVRWSVSR